MAHRFTIKEIAGQAGISTATVDRALNGRAHVSARTKARVRAAIAELEGQEAQLAARGRRVWVDVVGEVPDRFSREIRNAAREATAQSRAAVIQTRFHLQQIMDVSQTCGALLRIAKRGSDGVILKARDVPAVRDAVANVQARGIPVVALVTDVQGSTGYAGLNNAQAGQVAAALIARDMTGGPVLTSASRTDFAGEAARLDAFQAYLREACPSARIIALPPGGGLNQPTGLATEEVLAGLDAVAALYSVGGGNRAICAALQRRGFTPRTFVAHDLDADNRALLADGRISHVLHHDLAADVGRALDFVLAAKRLAPMPQSGPSGVQIIIRENLEGL